MPYRFIGIFPWNTSWNCLCLNWIVWRYQFFWGGFKQNFISLYTKTVSNYQLFDFMKKKLDFKIFPYQIHPQSGSDAKEVKQNELFSYLPVKNYCGCFWKVNIFLGDARKFCVECDPPRKLCHIKPTAGWTESFFTSFI